MTDELLDEEMVRELQRRTAELPREIEPPQEAWAGIKARIAGDSLAQMLRPARSGGVWWQQPGFLAAAAVLLIAAASVTTAIVMKPRAVARSGDSTMPIAAAPDSPSASQPGDAPATLAEFTAMEKSYIGTANRLSDLIESGRADLAPETIAKLKESLRIIDAAIIEARRALSADPGNKVLIEILSTQYGQKVDLLRRTAEMGSS